MQNNDEKNNNQSPINTFDNLYLRKKNTQQKTKVGFFDKIVNAVFGKEEQLENEQVNTNISAQANKYIHKTNIEIFSELISTILEQKLSNDINTQLFIDKNYRYSPSFVSIIAKNKRANKLIHEFEQTFNEDAKIKWIKQIWPQGINPKYYTLDNLSQVNFYLDTSEENISPIRNKNQDFLDSINNTSVITNEAQFDVEYSIPKDSNNPKAEIISTTNTNTTINTFAKIIVTDANGTHNYEMNEKEIILGRSTNPKITSDLVSSKHIRLWLENEHLMLEDCGSNNQGSVNGTFIVKTKQKLQPKTPIVIEEKISIRLAGIDENDATCPHVMIIRIVPKNTSPATPIKQNFSNNTTPIRTTASQVNLGTLIINNQNIKITKFPFSIGRSRDNDFVVEEKHIIVSRHHLVITGLSNKEFSIAQNKVTSKQGVLQNTDFVVKDGETIVLGAVDVNEDGNPLSITFKI